NVLNHDLSEDIRNFINVLSPGSLLIISIPTLPRRVWKAKEVFRFYQERVDDYISVDLSGADFTTDNIAHTLVHIIRQVVYRGMQGRRGISFEVLSKLVYADGREMLTLAGMICSKD